MSRTAYSEATMPSSQQVIYKAQSDTKPTSRPGRVKRFVISSNRPDRDGDVLAPSGAILDSYRTNGVVLFNHRMDLPAVGRCVDIGVSADKSKLWADLEFAKTELGNELFQLYDEGFMNACSVGLKMIEIGTPDWRRTQWQDSEVKRWINKWELLEVSLCAIGSQVDALMVRTKSLSLKDTLMATKRSTRSTSQRPADIAALVAANVAQKLASPEFREACVSEAVAKAQQASRLQQIGDSIASLVAKKAVDNLNHEPGGRFAGTLAAQARRLKPTDR
jgi:HK97 family phage prohead protease